MQDGWINVGDIETHYTWEGESGPPVLLLHGGGPGMSGELGFEPLFAPLAEHGFRVIAPDQLSMGRTDARPHAWPTEGFQSLVDHVAGFVEALDLDDIRLVGHSQGSYVGAKYVVDHPGRVRQAVFLSTGTICAAMGIAHPNNRGVAAIKAYDDTVEGLRRMLEATRSGGDEAALDLLAERLFANASRPGVKEARGAFEAARDRLPNDPERSAEFSLIGKMDKLPIPARFIWGKDDVVAPYELAIQLDAKLPEIPFDFLEDCGHNVQYDQTQFVLDTLFAFFDGEPK